MGAARAVQQALGDWGRVVATVVAGYYVAERADAAVAEILDLIAAEKPDLLVAGPAFLAGRYGVACGALCADAQSRFGVPAVTGMHPEHPAEWYRRLVPHRHDRWARRCLECSTRSAARCARAQALWRRARRRARTGGIFPARDHPQYPRRRHRRAAGGGDAADKLAGRPVTSEVPLPDFPRIPARPAHAGSQPRRHRPRHRRWYCPPRQSRWTPRPSRPRASARTASEAVVGSTPGQYDNVHRGYDTKLCQAGPASPGARRRGARAGAGRRDRQAARDHVFDHGCGHHARDSERMGREIAAKLRAARVDAVILTST